MPESVTGLELVTDNTRLPTPLTASAVDDELVPPTIEVLAKPLNDGACSDSQGAARRLVR